MLTGIFRSFTQISLALAGMVFLTAGAQAAAFVRYVSATGNDANKCTMAAPCKTLQRGINVTPANGELRVLASGHYGATAVIGKSMTINGNGHTIRLDSPITVDNGGAFVVLRRLVLNGAGSTQHGIEIAAATAVHIEGCVVQFFASHAILLAGNSIHLSLVDSIVRYNWGDALKVDGVGQAGVATIDNSRFENNAGAGLTAAGMDVAVSRSVAARNGAGFVLQNARMTIAQTTAAQNAGSGYYVVSGQLTLKSSVATENNTGVTLNTSSANLIISDSAVVSNGTGIYNNGGTLLTQQNNTLALNNSNLSGSWTALVAF